VGLKSFFVSTPILSAGRSRRWPKEDWILKSGPRNFDIVLALVGDSTMTRFFGIDVVFSLEVLDRGLLMVCPFLLFMINRRRLL